MEHITDESAILKLQRMIFWHVAKLLAEDTKEKWHG